MKFPIGFAESHVHGSISSVLDDSLCCRSMLLKRDLMSNNPPIATATATAAKMSIPIKSCTPQKALQNSTLNPP